MTLERQSPVAPPADGTAKTRILVWDAPIRVFHWLMVLAFAGAYLTAESDRWRLVHVTLGYTMAGLVAFRMVWGLVGTRYARFSDFVRGPASILRYARALLRGRPEHFVGHNPAGAAMILGLLVLTALVALSGWATYHDLNAALMEELHEALANLMLILVGVHVVGVLVGSWVDRENLVAAMINGRKRGRSEDAARSAWRTVAALLLVAVLGFWWFEWSLAPAGNAAAAARSGPTMHSDTHDDD